MDRAHLVLIQRQHFPSIPLAILERDYVLMSVLRAIFEHPALDRLFVLKGGVALHRLYLHRRLSLDLDFTTNRPIMLNELQPVIELAELQAVVKEHQIFHDALTIKRLRFVGPLGYPSSIKIDISFREKVILPPVRHLLATPYFEPFPVRAMQLAEVAAEKLRALSMRHAPRDLYDLWAMLRELEIDVAQVTRLLPAKLATVSLTYDRATLLRQLAEAEATWESDLDPLMAQLPDFEQVADELGAWLKELPLHLKEPSHGG
ncbi:MAG: nucleotidyl transferase AbiEii/AbiGii toxin family protein [Anaerolineae bacterium]|nr:nucleotidyl transferase AbiEii/AbiGii toxin family protein [Anaerolineae bacterium]